MKSSYRRTSPAELPLIKEVDQIKDEGKTKEDLINELVELRQRVVELEKSELLYGNLFESANDVIFIISSDGKIVSLNPAFEAITGWSRAEWLGKNFQPIVHPDDLSFAVEIYQHVLNGKTLPPRLELRILLKSGGYVTAEFTITPLMNNGIPSGLGIARDITKRKGLEEALRKAHNELEKRVQERTAELEKANKALQAEIAERKRAEGLLREAEAKYRSIFENAVEGISQSTLDGRFIAVNPALAHMLGYESPDELINDFPESQKIYVDPGRQTDLIQLMQADGVVTGFENQLRRKDGSIIWVMSNSRPLRDSGGQLIGFEAMLTDITERKRVEEALRKTHDELEKRVQERTVELEETNKALYAEITARGYAEDQIREQASFLDKAHDAIVVQDMEHRLIYWNKGAQCLYGWTGEEARGKCADELLYKDKEESPRLIEAKKSIIERGEWTGELYQITKEGKEIIVESRWTLILGRRGRPKSILVINMDITEKKKIEAQLLRAQRLESIGTLAGGIAHDLNNMLTPIMLSTQILKEKFTDEQSQKLLNILEDNTQRGADLVKQVLSFARGIDGERKVLQITYLISEIKRVLQEIFPKSIEVRTNVPIDLCPISGDATQLHQVLMNLCLNARDAMPYGGKLSISAEKLFIDENYARINVGAKAGLYIVITISDTGAGIPPEIMDRIFEPFFTTKEHGKGTGIGLSTALGIVKGHGGLIDVHSQVGKGSTFKIYLPATAATELQKAEEQRLKLYTGQGEVILIVDDEDSIRETTCMTLEVNGYRVITAKDGIEAIPLYAQNRKEIKVVLMDMMMPVMDGPACIRALRRINPKVKIIAVSGLAEKDRFLGGVDHISAFLPKPYTTEKLLKTIHEV